MNILLIDNGTRQLQSLERALAPHTITTLRFEEFDFEFQVTGEHIDLVVLSGGGQYSVIGNELRFAKEIEFVRTSPIPILGICLGAELIAHAFGATLELLGHKETGPKKLEVLIPSDPLFDHNPQLQVFESHRWAITSLSSELIGLARSESGYEIIRHPTLPRLGFQFHPESSMHTSGGMNLLQRALETLPKQKSP